MSVVSERILRRVVEVSRVPEPGEALLEQAGLSTNPSTLGDSPQLVPAERYYQLLERCGAGDPTLPLRYGDAVTPEDFGAFGLALKTADDVRDVLQRLARYILLISDTLSYALGPDGAFVILGRPADDRRGVQLANECALAAIVSLLRQVASEPVQVERVSLRHGPAGEPEAAPSWFGGEVVYAAAVDALHFSDATLRIPTRLADEGLSRYLLAQLEAQHAQRAEGAVVLQVRRLITDGMCTGLPTRDTVARRLGMSARTLHRRLAEQGWSFQEVANQVRREAAESLLVSRTHSLAEVAYLTGFADQSAFQRAFKAWTGQTPMGFRRAAR